MTHTHPTMIASPQGVIANAILARENPQVIAHVIVKNLLDKRTVSLALPTWGQK